MKYDFDKIIERRATGALKYDALEERYGDPDLLPLWVADMDFATPPFILEALQKTLDQKILGYTVVSKELPKAIIDWNSYLHNWKIKREWLNFIPGIVKGIGYVINLFTLPGDKIIIQPPVYHPFRMVPEGNERQVVTNPLIATKDGYEMNLTHLEELTSDPKCKLLILSNPHNPAGIVWPIETLRKVADICQRNNVIVISDEIHSDMVLWGGSHHPFPTVSEEAADCSITFAAPSKTFNIAGVVSAYSVVINPELRNRFYSWMDANEFSEPTIFTPPATIAAFTQGKEWRLQMLGYVESNIEFLIEFFKEQIPLIRPMKPGASFLVWLDCRKLGLSHDELIHLFVDKARLALNDGEMFGPGGEGFMRINVAAPRKILEIALERLRDAVNSLDQK